MVSFDNVTPLSLHEKRIKNLTFWRETHDAEKLKKGYGLHIVI
jgi:hypothetical protein